MMNTKPVETAKNPLLGKALPALLRAAEQARKLAIQTDTSLVIQENGHIRHIRFTQNNEVAESHADYKSDTGKS